MMMTYLFRIYMKTIPEIRRFLISEGYNFLEVDLFLGFHKANRHVFEAYERKAFELINAGAKRLSSKGIFERLREDASIQTSGSVWKLSNDYTSYYARCFAFKHPQHKGLLVFKPVNLKIAA